MTICHTVLTAASAALLVLNLLSVGLHVEASCPANSTAQAVHYNGSAPVIETEELPNGVAGIYYDSRLTASGGSGTYYWSVYDGALPPGLTLSESGTLTGTPRTAGPYNFTLKVTDSQSRTATRHYTVIIGSISTTVPAINTVTLPDGAVGSRYSLTLTATGGSGYYTWSLVSGKLPDGLSLNSNGVLSGTPQAVQKQEFTIMVTDSRQLSARRTFTLVIGAAVEPTLNITTVTLPQGLVGVPYSATLTATGGTGNYTWKVTSGDLPPGLMLSAGGVISGSPTTATVNTFTVTVTDPSKYSGSRNFTIRVITADYTHVLITTESLPAGKAGVYYNRTLTATGGAGGYTWKLFTGELPQGFVISREGVIHGTPPTRGTYTFTVRVTDANSLSDERTLSLFIEPAASPPASAAPPVEEKPVQQETPSDPFTYTGLAVTPPSAGPGQKAAVTVNVSNRGPGTAFYTVALLIDGAVEAKSEVTLESGQSRNIAFAISRNAPGRYTVSVGPLSAPFTVSPPASYTPWIAGGIIALLGLLVWLRINRIRRKERNMPAGD